jgi:hypothetical protein
LPSVQYHTRLWLAAFALIFVVVLANFYPIERQDGSKPRIYLVDVGAIRISARDIGLVSNGYQQKAFAFQFVERCARAWCNNQLT